ncbi:MAG TPA: ATP-binding cassette domain-containing protein [Fimbriimonadaceae bacterium]|nr:ATP-binding cassette domain-containing protein [Fimbriimonadaceae bacterium]
MSDKPYYEMRETLLKAEGVSLHLGGNPILRDVNLDLKNIARPGMTQGQIVGLLGPSGMGKTQLFRILSGLNVPDVGRVTLKGDVPVSPGRVGVVAQDYPLLMHRTVMSNMLVAGRRAGLSAEAATAKANEVLDRFGIQEHADKYPAQLSGGQRQRVSIAQQLVCSDHLLLMDEPFSGLDPNALTAVCNFLVHTAQTDEFLSFIVVTHDIESAVRICDTLWLLGRERDEKGNPIPGANIRTTVNLIDCGLAWHPGIEEKPEFFEKVKEVKALFASL